MGEKKSMAPMAVLIAIAASGSPPLLHALPGGQNGIQQERPSEQRAAALDYDRIRGAMKSEDFAVRNRVFLQLWQFTEQHRLTAIDIKPLVPALADAVLDRNLNVRFMAASTLKNVAAVAQPAVAALIKALNTFPGGTPALEGPQRYYADARAMAAQALGAIGPDAHEAIAALANAETNDPSADVRKAAGDAVKQIRTQRRDPRNVSPPQ